MNKYKIIALIGEAGSGKDTLLKEILKEYPNLHEIISCTTRPPREGEKHRQNYFFLTDEEFHKKVENNEMLESTAFRNWFYGTSFDSLDNTTTNVGVFNPDGIYALLKYPNIDVDIYYVRASAKTRLLRQLQRESYPDVNEIVRRYMTDLEDFSNLKFKYTNVINENQEDLKRAIKRIMFSLEPWEDTGQN